MNIAECLKCLIHALSRNEPGEALKYLAVGSDAYRFYLIFGGKFLWRMLNGIPAGHLQLDILILEDGVARAALRGPGRGKWSTVWLKQENECWQVTAAYPVRPEELAENGRLPEKFLALLSGRMPLRIACQDTGLRRFLNHVRVAWNLTTASAQDSSASSLFELTDYLWSRRILWDDLRQRGYKTAVFRTTNNNDIYTCSERHGRRRVAVKMLHNTGPRMKEKFLNEIKILESLRQHPSVPPILFSATADGLPYFGAEWAAGKSLEAEILKSPAWSLRERVRIMMNLARIISDFRDCKVMHRDLATDHIFVRENFELSVIDFGMSSFLHQLSNEKYQTAHCRELRNFGLLMCYLLLEKPRPIFGSPEQCIHDWGEAMVRLRACATAPELVKIIERTVAADPACRFITLNDKPPYSEVEEIFRELERVSGLL